MTGKLERTGEKVVMAYFKVLSWSLPGRSAKTMKIRIIIRTLVKILTGHLPNTCQKHCCLSQLTDTSMLNYNKGYKVCSVSRKMTFPPMYPFSPGI
jgi:hypothetical protein